MEETKTLAGQLLISMPGMTDPNFQQTVTYICEHSEKGALGIVINKPIGNIRNPKDRHSIAIRVAFL